MPGQSVTLRSVFGVANRSHANITDKLVRVIYTDLLPISTVEHESFKGLISFLASGYTIPKRKPVVARLKGHFEETKTKAMTLLASDKVQGVSLTCDLWTSIANDGYIGITSHFISEDWKLCSVTIGVEEMDERRTGENIAESL